MRKAFVLFALLLAVALPACQSTNASFREQMRAQREAQAREQEIAAAREQQELRATVIYDSLRTLPPSQLSERDMEWMRVYQQDRVVREAQANSGTARRALNNYLFLSALGVLVSVLVVTSL